MSKFVRLYLSSKTGIVHYSYSGVFTRCEKYMDVDEFDEVDNYTSENICKVCQRWLA